MGDPSLSPYLRVPDANPVAHDLSIVGGDGESTLFHINAEPNSYVGLTKDGVLLGGDLVGASGSADIALSGQGFSGEADLVVTCQNKLPYFATVPIGDASSVAGMTPVVSTLRIAPNPTRAATQIALDLPRSERVTLTILDLNGRLVRTLAQGQLPAGQHVYTWDGRDGTGRPVASGVYLTRLNDGRETRLGKTILSR